MTVKVLMMPLTVTDTADFRRFGLAFSNALGTVGLVQTADTGQINWGTVSKPALNTVAGYEVWRMNDTQQSSSPVFFLFEYGIHTNVDNFRLRISVGQGSDGSGALTGTVLGPRICHSNSSQVAATYANQNRASLFSCSDGFFGFCIGLVSTYQGGFFFCRSCDEDGVADDRAGIYHWGSGSVASYTSRQVQIFKPSVVSGVNNTQADPGAMALSPVSGPAGGLEDVQFAHTCFIPTPRPEPLFGVCAISPNNLPPGTLFEVAMVGATPRKFVRLPGDFGPAGSGSNSLGTSNEISATGLAIAFLWE